MYKIILYGSLLLFLYSCASNSRIYTPTHVEYGVGQKNKINEERATPKTEKNFIVHKIEEDSFFDAKAGTNPETTEEISFELVDNFNEAPSNVNKISELNQQKEANVIVNGQANSENVIVDLKNNKKKSKFSIEEKRKDFEKQISQTPSKANVHIVQSGDTVFSIARKYNLTPNQLVKMNNVNSNYNIQIGQKMVVVPVAGAKLSNSKKPNKLTPNSNGKKNEFSKVAGVDIYKYKPMPSQFGWVWPMMNSVLYKNPKKSSDKLLAQGITLQSAENQNVYAAKSGQVIFRKKYLNYGLTVLIKHDNNFISVYSFLQGIGVKLKQKVKIGELIGHIRAGSTSINSILYFEIREGGKPINPLKYLTKL